jgi:mRNA export factor
VCTVHAHDDRYVVGGIEGRCAVGYFDPALSAGENFAFKCHRDSEHAFAVNSISFHPQHNTFATSGSVGTFVFWDKDTKSRVKAFSRIPARSSITCGRFSADGAMFAYAQSYDWAKVPTTLHRCTSPLALPAAHRFLPTQ